MTSLRPPIHAQMRFHPRADDFPPTTNPRMNKNARPPIRPINQKRYIHKVTEFIEAPQPTHKHHGHPSERRRILAEIRRVNRQLATDARAARHRTLEALRASARITKADIPGHAKSFPSSSAGGAIRFPKAAPRTYQRSATTNPDGTLRTTFHMRMTNCDNTARQPPTKATSTASKPSHLPSEISRKRISNDSISGTLSSPQ